MDRGSEPVREEAIVLPPGGPDGPIGRGPGPTPVRVGGGPVLGPPCPCGYCPPDPGQACTYTGDVAVDTAYVANAYRGNLFLCPSDAAGPIGGLLHDLTPPQHYAHMGIFVADHFLIRHCTASQERLQAPEYYSGSILGQPVPVDGFIPAHVGYAWPGAVTQTVEQALIASQSGAGVPPGQTQPYKGASLKDWESQKDSSYLINALSFDSVSDDGKKFYPPLVVKPCPQLQTPQVTEVLGLVAAEALSIFAHYCFGAYTDGTVGGDPSLVGPPVKLPPAIPSWDAENNKWADWTGQVNWVTVPTIPAVCSSFVWQAIQNLNQRRHLKIILDWATSENAALGEAGGDCVRAIPPDWSGDNTDPDPRDGLFFYSEAGRKTAGQSLYDSIDESVYQAAEDKLGALGAVIDDVGRGRSSRPPPKASARSPRCSARSRRGRRWPPQSSPNSSNCSTRCLTGSETRFATHSHSTALTAVPRTLTASMPQGTSSPRSLGRATGRAPREWGMR